eukprot:CAMPEP_0115021056 /NCGR_PEP_ID=MMETSP0216-20121206/30625_1 /TAXON_ID=223996 /ORGANISM="Protocruzia adherens, Strain Boccale" /LENGTH=462 /DNA_ID=CAMNT_0002393271 /DNA_START=64 /DNA_END=1449 /DNA_ORIENTATION=-
MKPTSLVPFFLLALLLASTSGQEEDLVDEQELEDQDEPFEFGEDEALEDKFHADPDRQTAFPYNFVLLEDYSDDFVQVERSKGFMIEVPLWPPPSVKYENQEDADNAFKDFVQDYTDSASNAKNRKGWHLIYSRAYDDIQVEELGFFTKKERNPDLSEGEYDELEGDFIWEFTINQVGLYDLLFVYCPKDQKDGIVDEFENTGDVENVRYRKVTVHVVVDEDEKYMEYIDDDIEEDDTEDEGFEDDDKPSDEDKEEEEDEEEFYRYRKGDINDLLDEEDKLWDKNFKELKQGEELPEDPEPEEPEIEDEEGEEGELENDADDYDDENREASQHSDSDETLATTDEGEQEDVISDEEPEEEDEETIQEDEDIPDEEPEEEDEETIQEDEDIPDEEPEEEDEETIQEDEDIPDEEPEEEDEETIQEDEDIPDEHLDETNNDDEGLEEDEDTPDVEQPDDTKDDL